VAATPVPEDLPVENMSIKELKGYIGQKGGSIVGVSEKEELVRMASGFKLAAQPQFKSDDEATISDVEDNNNAMAIVDPAAAQVELAEEQEEKEDLPEVIGEDKKKDTPGPCADFVCCM
jgi:hypothetical protein